MTYGSVTLVITGFRSSLPLLTLSFLNSAYKVVVTDKLIMATRDIALDAQGNIYVAEYNNSRIQKFDSNGNFIRKWQNWSDLDGKFNYPVESKRFIR